MGFTEKVRARTHVRGRGSDRGGRRAGVRVEDMRRGGVTVGLLYYDG